MIIIVIVVRKTFKVYVYSGQKALFSISLTLLEMKNDLVQQTL